VGLRSRAGAWSAARLLACLTVSVVALGAEEPKASGEGSGTRAGAGGIQLPPWFSDNMVLQQARPPMPQTVIWGWGEPGDRVRVRFRNRTHPSDSGEKVGTDRRWLIGLGHLEGGGPETLEVLGRTGQVLLTNVVVGDVWLVGPWTSPNLAPGRAVDTATDHDLAAGKLRFLHAPRWGEWRPGDGGPGWQIGSKGAASQPLNSMAFYFGHELLWGTNAIPLGIVEVPRTTLQALSKQRPPEEDQARCLVVSNIVSEARWRARYRAQADFRDAVAQERELAVTAQREGRVHAGAKLDQPHSLNRVHVGSIPQYAPHAPPISLKAGRRLIDASWALRGRPEPVPTAAGAVWWEEMAPATP